MLFIFVLRTPFMAINFISSDRPANSRTPTRKAQSHLFQQQQHGQFKSLLILQSAKKSLSLSFD